MKLVSNGDEVTLISALDAVVTVRSKRTKAVLQVEPTAVRMSPAEWGVISNLGGTENLTRWYGYDIATETVVEVVPHG